MENGWPPLVENPSGNKPTYDFAILIDNIEKIVFSNTLTSLNWKNSKLVKGELAEEFIKLKEQAGKNIIPGGPSLILQLLNLNLIDEFQFCVQPIILGSGLSLFKNINSRIDLKLLNTKVNGSGAVTLYYEPAKLRGS